MTDQKTLHGADFLRAAACIAVLFHHLAFRMDMNQVPEALVPVMRFLVMGSFGVAVFFVLSGYLLARPFWLALDRGEPMPSMRVYWIRRLARIVPGFWLALAVSLLLDVWLTGAPTDGQTITRFVAGALLVSDWHWVTLFPVDNNGPLWSIGFEVTAYLLLPFAFTALFAFALKSWTSRLAWLGVIVAVLGLHLLILNFAPIDEVQRGWDHGLVGGAKAWMPRYNPIGFFAIFAIGALAAGVGVMIGKRRRLAFDAIGIAAVLACGLIMAVHVGGLNEGFGWLEIPYAFPAMPIAVAVALFALAASRYAGLVLDAKPVRFIAKISFGIYIWHALIIWLLDQLTPAFDGSWSNWLASSAAVIALSVLVATLSFYFVEQPAVRWARRLEQKPAVKVQRSPLRSRWI